MSVLFENYEREYIELSGALTCSLNDLQRRPRVTTEQVQVVQAQLAEINEALRNMEVEVQSLPSQAKAKLISRLQYYQKDSRNLEKELKTAKAAAERSQLLSNGTPDHNNNYSQRLQDVSVRMDTQTHTLLQAKRLCAEMEETGDNTKLNLHKQREAIERTLGTVRETSVEVSRSRKLLALVQRRSVINKIIMGGVIFFLFGVIVLIIYFKWIRA
eukprot:NODE_4440_length_787_cov_28.039394_g4281_i0.p1 GENE.NODE_4440_length_787_cov_28.039394_g4281_i0~~NODE_4440_length_787_cov_28.039394_g4281_i0.p1  ORF type:complete len:215 (+),score=60.84 NODE_4440_length_787_cov_28.039394_g4281_i0:59-703(+)